MAKNKKPEEVKPGAPAWTATFSDLMNLLLCFFVLLFSMSSVDAAKYEEVAKSFAETFSIFEGGGTAIGDGVLVSNGVSQLNELSQYFNSMGVSASGKQDNEVNNNSETEEDMSTNGGLEGSQDSAEAGQTGSEEIEEVKEELTEAQLKASEELAEKIEEAIEESSLGREIDIDYTSQYVLLTMNGSLLFDSGSATIKDDAKPVLNKLGQILQRYAEDTIEIEGHTDNVPIGGKGQFASNDELSGARALSVFQYLLDTTLLDPAHIKHSGRGEYVPIADNSTPEGRAKNRRVEIKIYNELSDAS
ncbi:MAG: flagellar motor protein MotB [Lachnospiraceae bacterium]|nr:flagellar motor protein MotB [Lachnospiraceae bacterium]